MTNRSNDEPTPEEYRPSAPEEQKFYGAYERLARDGKCDCASGGEYLRVLAEWQFQGCPPDIEAFIIKRANAWPIMQPDGSIEWTDDHDEQTLN
jgi:hypothetical protein